MKKAKIYFCSSFKTSNQHFIRYLYAILSKTLLLSAILDFGGHLELPKDANLASSGFQIRIPIPTYFCKKDFYRRYCTVILGSCRTSSLLTRLSLASFLWDIGFHTDGAPRSLGLFCLHRKFHRKNEIKK